MQPQTPSGSDDAKASLERRRSLRLRHSNLSLDSSSGMPNRLLTDSPVSKQRKRRSTTTLNESSNYQRKRSCENDDDSSLSNRNLTSDLNTVTPLVTSKVNEKSFLSRLNESKESPKHGKIPKWMIRSIISPEAKKLPPGVIDLYSFDDYNRVCSCDDDHCSCQSLSHVYLRHYGAKYYQYLKDWEDLNWPTIAAKSIRLYGGNSSTDEDSSSSASSSRISRRIQHIMGNITSDDEQSLDLSITSQQLEHQPHLTEKMRAVLIDWLIELSEEYKLSLRTLHLTIALINRSLECGQEGCSRRLVIERDMFQCLGCACMWMACKMEEITAPSVDDFVYISADSYSKHEITEMESAVCDALQFQLMQVTPYDASIELWRASRADRMPTEFSCIVEVQHPERSLLDYLLELSALSYTLASVSPRKVASAAVYLSRIVLGLPGWSPTLEYVSGWKSWDLEDVVLTLYQYYASAEESKLTNAYLKYSKTKYHCVALKTVPLEQDLGF